MPGLAIPTTWRDEIEHRRLIAERLNTDLQSTWINVGEYQSASGTEVKLIGIPIWAVHVDVLLDDISAAASEDLYLRLGYDSDTDQTTGYNGLWSRAAGNISTYTTEFQIARINNVADAFTGKIELDLLNRADRTWTMTSGVSRSNSAEAYTSFGRVTMDGAPTYALLYWSSGTTFDNGGAVLRYQ